MDADGREPDEVAEHDERRTTDGFPRSSNGVGELDLLKIPLSLNPGAPERQPGPPFASPVRSCPVRRLTAYRSCLEKGFFLFHASPLASQGPVVRGTSTRGACALVFRVDVSDVRGE